MPAVATDAERFTGFSDDSIQFLLDLQAEQSRTWFKAHETEFRSLLRRPLELFVEELRDRLIDVYPGLRDVEPHYFRIQRDTRFAKDKAPYKTNVAANMAFRERQEHEEEHGISGLYVSFGLDGEFIGAGAWHMSPEVLQRYRAMLDSRRDGPRFKTLVDQLRQQGFSIEAMEKLKRVPAPYAQDHPRAELLKYKGFAVGAQPPENASRSRELLDWAEAQLRAVAPAMTMLDNALTRRPTR